MPNRDPGTNEKVEWVNERQRVYIDAFNDKGGLQIAIHDTFRLTRPLWHNSADTHHYLAMMVNANTSWPVTKLGNITLANFFLRVFVLLSFVCVRLLLLSAR